MLPGLHIMSPKNAKYNKEEDAPTASDSLTVWRVSSLGTVDHKLDQICSMVKDHSKRISSLETFSNDTD